MRITYERLYHGGVFPDAVVPPDVRAGAERRAEFILPSRELTLYTRDGREFRCGGAWSSECWRVTYTPEAPTLPELGAVREQERPTPPVAEAPAFTLTAPCHDAGSHQPKLFNG